MVICKKKPSHASFTLRASFLINIFCRYGVSWNQRPKETTPEGTTPTVHVIVKVKSLLTDPNPYPYRARCWIRICPALGLGLINVFIENAIWNRWRTFKLHEKPSALQWEDPGSCYFRHWPSRCQQKTYFLTQFFCLLLFEGTVHLHYFSKKKVKNTSD